MNEDGQQTPSQDPAATGGDEPAATKPNGGDGATKDDDTVTLKREDYKNLVSQRDRSNNSNVEAESFLLSLAKEREIDSFLDENKEAYPDVTRDDLMYADSPEQLEELAKQRQRRYEDVVQRKLMDVQKFNAPTLTPAEKEQKLEELKKNPGKGTFAEMVRLKLSR